MKKFTRPTVVLIADGAGEYPELVRQALSEFRSTLDLRSVKQGPELMDYLLRRGPYSDPETSPRPCLILCHFTAPLHTQQTPMQEIKTHPSLRSIPLLVLVKSASDAEVAHAYRMGVNSVITQPDTVETLVERVKELGKYWLEIVELPSGT